MNIDINHMHNRAEGTYISGASIRDHSLRNSYAKATRWIAVLDVRG